eukprot:6462637-Prymnesium_polylepis.1
MGEDALWTPDATVLPPGRAAASEQLWHRSFDGGGLLGRCTHAADTSAALRPDSWLEQAGPEAQLSSPLSAHVIKRRPAY